jgi:hypothetical protein
MPIRGHLHRFMPGPYLDDETWTDEEDEQPQDRKLIELRPVERVTHRPLRPQ